MEGMKWYLQRAMRMSPTEVAFRALELSKKQLDSRRSWMWDKFGDFGGRFVPLKCLTDRADSGVLAFHRTEAETVSAGEFSYLGVNWPKQTNGWRSKIWHVDPVTSKLWPGAGIFTFKAPYRHRTDRGDVKLVWEVNRLQFLQSLAAVAAHDADETRWKQIADFLRGWMSANPPFDGINWNSGIENATRIVSLLVALSYAGEREREGLSSVSRQFIQAHTYWLYRYPSRFSSANNHKIAELAGLFLAAVSFPELPQAEKYCSFARAELEKEIEKQILPDGVGVEQSPTYSGYALEWLLLAARAAEEIGQPFSETYRNRVRASEQYMRWFLDDAGHPPRIGDDDEGHVLRANYSEPEQYVRRIANVAACWLKDCEPIASGLKIFREGGYTVVRDNLPGPTLVGVLDHGPLGYLSIAAHGHADSLSFWLHSGTEPIFVDAGTYLYHSGGSQRDKLRGTPMHNTVSIEASDQSSISGPFSWSRHAKSRLLRSSDYEVVAECDGYFDRFGIRHQRSLQHLRGLGFRIEDRLVGQPNQDKLNWSLGFTLHPSVACTIDGDGARLTTPSGQKFLMRTVINGDRAEWVQSESCYSPRFNVLERTVRLIVEGVLNHETPAIASTEIRVVRG